ncbi:hypothetical protein M5689_001150 [Euphorbia peplus]|nr:hypothetical protein M5689_001150 [Euphorbia peplus]
MDIARVYQIEEIKTGSRTDSMSNMDTLLVIKLPDSWVLRVLSRSLFLTMVILTLPCIGSVLRRFSQSPDFNISEADGFVSDLIDVELVDALLLDLANEGLVKKGDKAFFVCSMMGSVIDNSRFLNANEIDWVFGSDVQQKMLLKNASFDFVFVFGSEDVEFLDRILKVGGVLITQLGAIPSVLQKQSNYKVAYLRRFSSTIVGTRKTSLTTRIIALSAKRQLSVLKLEAKKSSLDGLEDILLEPPRKPYFGQFKYLPDLLGDSLEDYQR